MNHAIYPFRSSLSYFCWKGTRQLLGLLFLISSTSIGTGQESSPQNTLENNPANSNSGEFDRQLLEEWKGHVQPLLVKYCVECHGKSTAEADVNLELYQDLASIRKQPALWDQVRGVARIGAMPPPDSPQLSEQEKERLSRWVEEALHRTDCTVPQSPGHVTIRRLNNIEYDNTIRDLFALDTSISQKIGFVSDDVGNGFDNQGEVLSLNPLLLEKYFQGAELVANLAIVTNRESLRKQTKEGGLLFADERCSAEFDFADGEYEISIRAKYGEADAKAKATILIDGEEVKTIEIGNKTEGFTLERTMVAGRHRIEVRSDVDRTKPPRLDHRIEVERFRMDGPKKGDPAYPASHLRVISVYPSDSLSMEEAAFQNLSGILRVAYRRPAEPMEVAKFVPIVMEASRSGMSFEESMKFGLQAVLVSPQFLFRIEKSDQEEVRSGVYRVDPYDLATRISYFLWSAPPDEILLKEAETGGLYDSARLHRQVERMLDDPRSKALVQGFFAQWLGLRNLTTIEVDAGQYPRWSDRLRDSMNKETELFCEHLLSTEGKISDVLNADFTFLNPRLAELYGLPYEDREPSSMYLGNPGRPIRLEDPRRSGLYMNEDRYVKASLPGTRRGMLTQASILTLTSNPSRTSPVKRGKWVLENILGDPPPPAPPNAPSFEETQKEHKQVSLRKQLEIHRSNPSCASCHKMLDPIGLGLESFNAIGEHRERDNGQPIEADGELMDGRKFSGAVELLEALQSDLPKISRHFSRMMMTYALGRGLTTADECAIDEVVARAKGEEFHVRSFVHGVISSPPFQFHQVESPPTEKPSGL